MAKKEEVIIDDPIERHNRKVELIKNDLNHINTLLDKLYRKAEPIPEPSELKEVKMSDLNEIRSKLNLMNELLFEKMDFNKHRVWRVMSEIMDNYDDKLLGM